MSLAVNLQPGNGFQSPLLGVANAHSALTTPSFFPLIIAMQQP
jgi:hypothetical protein